MVARSTFSGVRRDWFRGGLVARNSRRLAVVAAEACAQRFRANILTHVKADGTLGTIVHGSVSSSLHIFVSINSELV